MKISFSGIFFGFISVCVGCFFLAGTWAAYLDYNRVQEYSGRAGGHITKKHFQTTADGSGKYYLDYWFVSADGYKISATDSIAKQQWDTLQNDDSLEVRFDPSNPHNNIPLYGRSPSLVLAFFMLVLGTVFILFGCSRFFNSFQKRHFVSFL